MNYHLQTLTDNTSQCLSELMSLQMKPYGSSTNFPNLCIEKQPIPQTLNPNLTVQTPLPLAHFHTSNQHVIRIISCPALHSTCYDPFYKSKNKIEYSTQYFLTRILREYSPITKTFTMDNKLTSLPCIQNGTSYALSLQELRKQCLSYNLDETLYYVEKLTQRLLTQVIIIA